MSAAILLKKAVNSGGRSGSITYPGQETHTPDSDNSGGVSFGSGVAALGALMIPADANGATSNAALKIQGPSGSGGIAGLDRPRGSKPNLLGSLEGVVSGHGSYFESGGEDFGIEGSLDGGGLMGGPSLGRSDRATLGQMAEQIQANARAYALANSDESDDGAGGGEEEGEEEEGTAGEADDEDGVCLPGHEQTGRWTRQEHDLFLEALKKYGKVRGQTCIGAWNCRSRRHLNPQHLA